MLNQFDLTEKRAELHPQRIAFYEPERDLQISYGDLDQQATALAAALQNRGYAPGARIAVLCLNRHEFFTLLFACAKASLILVPLNWRLAVGELVPMLEDCGAELLIYDEANQQTTSCLAEATAIDTLAMDATTDEESLATLLASTVQDFSCRSEWPADEIWYMLYTSGTTGTPKAVLQTFGMALANYVNIDQAIDLTSRDITLNFLPLFHTAGINLYTLPHLISGAAIVIHSRFDPAAVLQELQQRITTFFGVPAIYQALSLDPGFHQTDLSKVRSWGCGGAPLTRSLIDIYATREIRVRTGFGMTETGPTVFLVDEDTVSQKPGSVGKPLLMNKIKVVDRNGQTVEPGQPGEMLLKGPGITPGYWRRPEATAAAIDPDGWLHSGDVVRVDEQGDYFIIDRWKDMYISGGENVYPAEVEKVLDQHPQILEAAIVGIADQRWGEVGCAFITTHLEQPIDEDEVVAFCRQHLANYKVPRRVEWIKEFPRTAAGKIQKHLLREQIAEVSQL